MTDETIMAQKHSTKEVTRFIVTHHYHPSSSKILGRIRTCNLRKELKRYSSRALAMTSLDLRLTSKEFHISDIDQIF
jgi:hypothetical protein